MNSLFQKYLNTFKGLSKEIWFLAAITLVNRAGMMVIPFLSIYLTKEIGLTYQQVGWIMTCYGVGSLIGAWSGGKLSDRIGAYKVMVASFVLGGIGFILLQFLTTFISICIGVFFLTLVADAFRPALFVSMSNYAKPENKTRSVTLVRLAINLGMSLGPTFGGALILGFGYAALFWLDGITNIIAGVMLLFMLHPKRSKVLDEQFDVANPLSPYKDSYYILLLAGLYVFTIAFLQYFSTMPVYYREIHGLTEAQIGLLMGMNGFIIFLIEMPVVQYIEKRKFSKFSLLIIGMILLGASFLILPLIAWTGVLIFSMLLMTFGEILVFPSANTLAINRAKKGKQGEYMALFSMNFSVAHIFSHNIGMQSVDRLGFNGTWLIIAGITLIGILIFFELKKRAKSAKNA